MRIVSAINREHNPHTEGLRLGGMPPKLRRGRIGIKIVESPRLRYANPGGPTIVDTSTIRQIIHEMEKR
jgi:hypothetical protein